MKYKVDHEGNVSLQPTYKDLITIENALASKYVQMRKNQEDEEIINEMIPLRVALNNAISSGRKVRHYPKDLSISHSKKSVIKHCFWESIRNFFDPPYSISDFETAVTLSGQKHTIISMDFPEDGRSHPSNVIGQIFFLGAWYNANWNSHGYCECNDLHPDDLQGFHLVHFDHNDTLSVATVFLLIIIVLIIFLIASLFIP